jgi:ATP-dependent DNA helicase RecQ
MFELNEYQQKILKSNFGFSSLRESQKPIINSILSGQDTLAIMPTGGGKSLCYQFPALLFDGLTVVISPLIALMKDQVENLKENGIWAEYINSSQSEFEKMQVWEALKDVNNKTAEKKEKLKLLYIAPEKLFSGEGAFLKFLKKIKISLFAIDEAHCISNWGHDFRPEYTKLNCLKQYFPSTPIVALTATADELTRRDILQKLNLPQAKTFISSFDRPNIYYHIEPKIDAFEKILSFIKARKNQSGIIYSLSRKSTEQIANKLEKNGISAVAYHAKLTNEQKTKNYNDFMTDKVQVVVATIAFGMGIDKPNVRFVIHWNLPKNIENYYQETGRAGRDGLPGEALLLYDPKDSYVLKKFIQEGSQDLPHLDKETLQIFRQIQSDKLDRLLEFCQTTTCRRRVLLNYFNENLEEDCGYCDICDNPPKKIDGKILAQKILSAIVRTNQTHTSNYIIDILCGKKNPKIIANNHHKLPTFGIGKDIQELHWQFYINQLLDLGILKIQYQGFSKNLVLTQKAVSFLEGDQSLELVEFKEKETREKKQENRAELDLDSVQKELLEKLKILRRTLAKQEGVPAFVIFSDASLVNMLEILPINKAEFETVTGVGKVKAEKFAEPFTDLIKKFRLENPDIQPKRFKKIIQKLIKKI